MNEEIQNVVNGAICYMKENAYSEVRVVLHIHHDSEFEGQHSIYIHVDTETNLMTRTFCIDLDGQSEMKCKKIHDNVHLEVRKFDNTASRKVLTHIDEEVL